MRSSSRRAPFDHVKEIYGERLEKYSYDEIKRDQDLHKKILKQNTESGPGYESIRGKILDFVILVFIFLMLGAGVYFIFTSIIEFNKKS